MGFEQINHFFTQYGMIAIFVIVLLEYMNFPGFPAGVIMPLAGVWAAHGKMQFLFVWMITIAAGLIGSWILYLIGRKGGEVFLKIYIRYFPKQKPALDRNFELIRNRGTVGIFVSKLIPMVRTLIPIPAGILKMNFWKYTVSSMLGIGLWNLAFVGAGYWLGDAVFSCL